VIISSEKKLQPGNFYNVRITKAFDYDLEGEVIY
jgi:ribosomal protein S12 methylthiotransferase